MFLKVFLSAAQSVDLEFLFSGTEEADSILAILIEFLGIMIFIVYILVNLLTDED